MLIRWALLSVSATDCSVSSTHPFSPHIQYFAGARNKHELAMKNLEVVPVKNKISNHKIDHWLKPNSDLMGVASITAAVQCL